MSRANVVFGNGTISSPLGADNLLEFSVTRTCKSFNKNG